MTSCAVATCTRNPHTRSYCRAHYQRLLRSGNPILPPSRLVDHVIVDRAVHGQWPGPLTIAEKEEAVRRLDRLSVPSSDIAVRLRFASRNSVAALRRRVHARAGVTV